MSYWFVDREWMEQEIKENRFLEYGEHNGNLYGTHIQSIKDVINGGKSRNCFVKISVLK